jgi:hypothetical protein
LPISTKQIHHLQVNQDHIDDRKPTAKEQVKTISIPGNFSPNENQPIVEQEEDEQEEDSDDTEETDSVVSKQSNNNVNEIDQDADAQQDDEEYEDYAEYVDNSDDDKNTVEEQEDDHGANNEDNNEEDALSNDHASIPTLGPSVYSIAVCGHKHNKDVSFLKSNEWKKGVNKKQPYSVLMDDYNQVGREKLRSFIDLQKEHDLKRILSSMNVVLGNYFVSIDDIPVERYNMESIINEQRIDDNLLTDEQKKACWVLYDEYTQLMSIDPMIRAELHVHDAPKAIMLNNSIVNSIDGNVTKLMPPIHTDNIVDVNTLHPYTRMVLMNQYSKTASVQYRHENLREDGVPWSEITTAFHEEVIADIMDSSRIGSFRGSFIGPICANHIRDADDEDRQINVDVTKNWRTPIGQPPTSTELGGDRLSKQYNILKKVKCTFKKNAGTRDTAIQAVYELVTVPCDPPTSPTDNTAFWDKDNGAIDPLSIHRRKNTYLPVSREFVYTILANQPKMLALMYRTEERARQIQHRGKPLVATFYGNRVIIPSQTNQMCGLKYVPYENKRGGSEHLLLMILAILFWNKIQKIADNSNLLHWHGYVKIFQTSI